ncbi:MAG: UDP-2,3-diacylglucosamine diphosphatase [Gammaproteobacteria bacterium]|jgi:UDP-2,3-diacylglucosamine hydrolase|nr:MAG: UDP-2,3-diacylglucosamine diphosphatase [Gammaproteobacteria bacterium]
MDTLFIADLHLSEKRPEKLALFLDLLRGSARQSKALYILGDLFEHFWLGNDDRTPPVPKVLAGLREFCAVGGKLYIVRGNRDLMLDSGIEGLTGGKLLPDFSVVEISGKRVLLCHGDLLCSRDVSYQLYRKFMELAAIRAAFRALPYRLRSFITSGLRPLMRRSSQYKSPVSIDTDQLTIERLLRSFGCAELIHGHTHRPGMHDFLLDGQNARRIVLGDWYDEDSVLLCRDGERRLLSVAEYSSITI